MEVTQIDDPLAVQAARDDTPVSEDRDLAAQPVAIPLPGQRVFQARPLEIAVEVEKYF